MKVGSSVIFDPNTFTTPNYTKLLTLCLHERRAHQQQQLGSDPGTGAYDSKSQAYDALVRDVGAAGQNRQMVMVFAAGNDGAKAKTIDSPGTAKNVITVGASENVRSMTPANGGKILMATTAVQQIRTPTPTAPTTSIIFSSRGPCRDGRMKPDIVAPGTHITGGVAQTNPPPSPRASARRFPVSPPAVSAP